MGSSPKKSSAPQTRSDDFQDVTHRFAWTMLLCLIVYFVSAPRGDHSATTTTTTMTRKQDDNVVFWEAPKNGEFYPKIAWLMSFPNSGTSFTMTCVEHTSNRSTATNYGEEVTDKGDLSLSIYPRRPEGPFWEGLSGKKGMIRHLPDRYVLVKTHCGSRCVRCAPEQYVETYESFLDACRNASGRVAPDHKRVSHLYDTEGRVEKAIHLFRNPFHNLVARFHLDRKNMEKHGDWFESHPNNATGFQKWCAELDNDYTQQEYETFERDMLKQLRFSPCHGEVFKYIQWHNLAFEVTDRLRLDSIVVHYEDYEEATFRDTRDKIMDFLELDIVNQEPRRSFQSSNKREYAKYFTMRDKRRILLLVQAIASSRTWDAIKHYFDKSTSSIYETDLSTSYDKGKPLTMDHKKRI